MKLQIVKQSLIMLGLLGTFPIGQVVFVHAQAEPSAVLKAEESTLEQKYQKALQLLQTSETKLNNSGKAFSCFLYVKENRGGEKPEETYVALKVRRQPLQMYGYVARSESIRGHEYFFDSARKNEPQSFAWNLPRGDLTLYGLHSTRRLKPAHFAPSAIGDRFAEQMKAHVKQPHAEIKFYGNSKINGRSMQLIEICFSKPGPDQQFRLTRLWLDKETGLPSRYEAWDWPAEGSEENRMMEEFTYYQIKPIEVQEVEEYRF